MMLTGTALTMVFALHAVAIQLYLSIMIYVYTAVLEKFTVEYFHVKLFMLKYFCILGQPMKIFKNKLILGQNFVA